jgi:hypothetical protein
MNQFCKDSMVAITTDPAVVAHDQTVKLYGVDALYTARIKEVVNLYAQCDKILRQLTTTRIKAPTFILLSDKNGNGRLAQTSSARRNLLVFPQTFVNQSSYHSYSLSTDITEILIVLLHEYEHARQPRSLLYADSDAYRNLIEADADIYATRFLANRLDTIESHVKKEFGVLLDDEHIAKTHWIALGRMWSFCSAYARSDFVHIADADVQVERMLFTEENKKLLSQLECYDSVLSTRLSLFERKY